MSMYLYDTAMIEKVRLWMGKTEVEIFGPEDISAVFEINADKNNDKPLKLPLICVRRIGAFTVTNPNKQPLAYDGATIEATAAKSIQLNAIPISLTYQLDVYTRYFKEADEFVRNFIFNIINYPKLSITIPYNNVNLLHDSALKLNPEVSDNSDIPERIIKGQFSRLSLGMSVEDAYLWDTKIRDNYSIDVQYETE